MNLNKVMLIGRLGRDPEIRYTNSGSAVANFSLATTDTWKDKGGQKQERTEWHNIVAWGRLADFSQNYLKKGKLIYVEGRLQTRDWVDNQNVKHWKTETVANTINFMEKLGESGEAASGGAPGPYNDPGPQEPPQQDPGPPPEQGGEDGAYVEDDIPF
ncbi:MAG: single-stranded DNA-binding protein [SAR324 cluster bacterium]|nr:single-stranded DNA-binding protein [SAR324 cluster bacterium]MCZ6532824.1 single-stranded DNA-binding protein [SAR324 cluster bacterium]MCZ6557261.1 single-stranded DNA-binding protein [SAR324 cluster bacterium]MCZ6627892.1 single-stranded DNA-binding protein [SAR324 cluster bacterium]MCZ6729124.1 single-stranded DNA-binding protein [SAR324 cluster bacterium]